MEVKLEKVRCIFSKKIYNHAIISSIYLISALPFFIDFIRNPTTTIANPQLQTQTHVNRLKPMIILRPCYSGVDELHEIACFLGLPLFTTFRCCRRTIRMTRVNVCIKKANTLNIPNQWFDLQAWLS